MCWTSYEPTGMYNLEMSWIPHKFLTLWTPSLYNKYVDLKWLLFLAGHLYCSGIWQGLTLWMDTKMIHVMIEIGRCSNYVNQSRFNGEHNSKGLVCDCLERIKKKNLDLASPSFCIQPHLWNLSDNLFDSQNLEIKIRSDAQNCLPQQCHMSQIHSVF